MHDTDMAGLLYFARQYRFAHDALEDFFAHEGLDFDLLFHEEAFVPVIVHSEADYFSPLKVGDQLEVQVFVEKIGTSSFTMSYKIVKEDGKLIGTVKTVHVTLDRKTHEKIEVPARLRHMLERYLNDSSRNF